MKIHGDVRFVFQILEKGAGALNCYSQIELMFEFQTLYVVIIVSTLEEMCVYVNLVDGRHQSGTHPQLLWTR